MKKQKNMFQTKEEDKILEKDLIEMQMSDLSDEELKITKMLTEFTRIRHEQSDNFNKEKI